jgi:hypothetical protein
MSQIRISRPALDEVAHALKDYEALLAKLKAEAVIKENTQDTYFRYADMFVRWLHDEFDPGARKKG